MSQYFPQNFQYSLVSLWVCCGTPVCHAVQFENWRYESMVKTLFNKYCDLVILLGIYSKKIKNGDLCTKFFHLITASNVDLFKELIILILDCMFLWDFSTWQAGLSPGSSSTGVADCSFQNCTVKAVFVLKFQFEKLRFESLALLILIEWVLPYCFWDRTFK